MPRKLQPKTAKPRTRPRTGDDQTKIVEDRVNELLTRVRAESSDARRELDAVVRQLAFIEANHRRHPPKDDVGRFNAIGFSAKVRRLSRTEPPAIPRPAELVDVCTVVAENGWHLIVPTGRQKNTLAELAHLLRPVEPSEIENDALSKVSPKLAPPRKNRHTDGKVENRISGRALLAESVKELSARLESNPADRQWLLETLPLECGAIAAAFNDDAKYQGMLDRRTAEQIGTKLRKLREERELTQQQLAEHAGTFKQNVSEHEKGLRTPKLGTIKSYAAALGVQVEELLST